MKRMRRALVILLVIALVLPCFQVPAGSARAKELQTVNAAETEAPESVGGVTESQDGTEVSDIQQETGDSDTSAEAEKQKPDEESGPEGSEEQGTPAREENSGEPAEDEITDAQPDTEEPGTPSGTEEDDASAEQGNSELEEDGEQETADGETVGQAEDMEDGIDDESVVTDEEETDSVEEKSIVETRTLKIGGSVTVTDTTYVQAHHSNYRDFSTTYVWSVSVDGVVSLRRNGTSCTITGSRPGATYVSCAIALSYEYYDSRLGKWMPYYTEESGDAWYITVLGDNITVTFNANGGSVSPKSKIVTSGGTYGNLPTPTWKDHTFGGWYAEKEGGTEVKSTSTVTKLSSHTLYAHWIPHYKVTFDPAGGKTPVKQKMVVNGQPYGELPVAERDGYVFEGWYPSMSGGREVISSTMVNLTGDQTLYAGWSAIWTVTFDAAGGRTPISKSTVINGRTYGYLPIPERAGWTFDGWYTEKEGGTQIESDTKVWLSSNRTLYAHWLRNYTVTFHPMGGEVSVETMTVTYGRLYGELPEATRGDDGFVGWYTAVSGGRQITADTFMTTESNQILYARYKNSYKVLFDPTGGSVEKEDKNVAEGRPYGELPVAVREGYEFAGWYTEKDEGTLVTESTVVELEEEHTLYAHWGKWCTVRFNTNGAAGAVYPIEAVSGVPFTLPLVCLEKEMDNFDGWSYSGKVYQPGDSITVTGDTVLTAVWKGVYEVNVGDFFEIKLRAPGDFAWYRINGMGLEKKEYWYWCGNAWTTAGEEMDVKINVQAPTLNISWQDTFNSEMTGGLHTGQKLDSGNYYIKLQAANENEYGNITFCIYEKELIPICYWLDCKGTIISGTETSTTGELTVYKKRGGSLKIGSAEFEDTTVYFDTNIGERDKSSVTLSYSFKEWGMYNAPDNYYYKNAQQPGDIFAGDYSIHLLGKWKQDTRFFTPGMTHYYINGEPCYYLVGWYTEREGGTEVVSQSTFPPGSEITLYAHWEPVRCDVNLDANGGLISQNMVNLKYGKPYGELPIPIRKGYTFVGWAFDDSDPNTIIDSSTLLQTTTEHTLHAIWREGEDENNPDIPDIIFTVNVIFDTLDYGMAPAAYLDVPTGSTIQAPAEPKEEGYRFQGWYKDAECTEPWDFDTDIVLTEITLYAKWTSLRGGTTDSADGFYKVSFDTRGHGKAPAAYSRVAEGSLIEEPAEPAAEGYRFLGWYQDAGCTAPWDFETDTVWKDMILYAGWTRGSGSNGGNTGDDSGLEAMEINDMSYTGSALKPAMRVYSGGVLLKAGKDYTISYKNNVNANQVDAEGGVGVSLDDRDGGFDPELPYALVTGKGNYTGTLYINFNIQPAAIADGNHNLLSGYKLNYSENLTVSGRAQKVISSLKYRKAMKEGTDYRVSIINADTEEYVSSSAYLPAWETGAFLLTIIGTGNYTGTVEKVIYAAEKKYLMKNAAITLGKNLKTRAYTGSRITLPSADANGPDVFTVRMGSTYLTEGVDYEVSYTNNLSVGTATMTVAGLGSYQGVKRATFKITGKAFSSRNVVVGSGFQETLTYTGSPLTQNDVTLDCDGERLEYGKHYTILYKNNVKKGTATMTFRALPASGYSGQVQKKFRIAAASLDAGMLQEEDITVEYEPGGAKPEVTLIHNGVTLVKGTSYALSYTDNKGIGRATMKVTGKGNYTGSFSVPFTITQKNLADADIRVRPKSMAYKAGRAAAYEPGVQVLHGNSTVSAGEYRIEYRGNSNSVIENALNDSGAGRPTLTVKAAAGGNYTGSVTLELPVYQSKFTGKNTYIEVEQASYTGRQVSPEVRVWYGDSADALSAINALKTKKNLTDADIARLKAGLRLLEKDEDYMLIYGQNLLAGRKKGKVTVVGLGLRYGGSVSADFAIDGRKLEK